MSLQRDIRQMMSPPPQRNVLQQIHANQQQTPNQQQHTPRRRRIIDSDDSAQENQHPSIQEAGDAPDRGGGAAAVQRQDVVDLDSSSDDMYIPAAMQRRPDVRATPQQRAVTPSAALPQSTRRRTPQPIGSRRPRLQLEDEAVQSDHDDDDSSECVESDTNAQDLYRSSILSMRSARNARTQLRSETAPCAVCAKFAAFLQHFI